MNKQPTHRSGESSLDSELGALYRAHLNSLQTELESVLGETSFDGLVIFAGSAPIPPRDDQPHPFRVEPFFVRWCPLPDVPGAALVLAPSRRPVLIHPRSRDYWHSPPADPTGYWVGCFDVHYSDSAAQTAEIVKRLASGYAVIGEQANFEALGPANPDSLIDRLTYLRAFKSDYEIACHARANIVAAIGHRAVAEAFAADVSEFDLDLTYLRATRQHTNELPYPNIIALNEHAAVLHYQILERTPPTELKSLLIDAGAKFAGYASDVSRTSAADDAAISPLIGAMEVLQQTLCAEAQAGTDFVDLNDRAHQLLAGLLAEHDLVTCSTDEVYASGLTRLFLPHGLGHLLGLQVHDCGGWQQELSGASKPPPKEHPALRLTRKLEPGFVVTIEPGIYFIDQLLAEAEPALRRQLNLTALDRLRSFGGIRIEDDVAVKAGDNRNLTREAFAALELA